MRLSAWKLTLEYDGSRYRGWQTQKNARSIQDTLARAAREILRNHGQTTCILPGRE